MQRARNTTWYVLHKKEVDKAGLGGCNVTTQL